MKNLAFKEKCKENLSSRKKQRISIRKEIATLHIICKEKKQQQRYIQKQQQK